MEIIVLIILNATVSVMGLLGLLEYFVGRNAFSDIDIRSLLNSTMDENKLECDSDSFNMKVCEIKLLLHLRVKTEMTETDREIERVNIRRALELLKSLTDDDL